MLEQYSDQILGAALAGSGAVLSTALAWFWKRTNEWWKQPRVTIEIGNADGYVYENVLIKTYTSGMSTSSASRDAVFVRAKVTNKEGGYRTPEKARGCVGYLAGMEKWDSAKGAFTSTNYQDFLRLEWSFNKATHGMDLLPGVHVWLDILFVLAPKVEMEPARLKIASNPPVNRYGDGFCMPDLFRVKVQVSGENFRAESIQFFVMVANGSNMPEVLDEASWRSRLEELDPLTIEQICARSDAELATTI